MRRAIPLPARRDDRFERAVKQVNGPRQKALDL